MDFTNAVGGDIQSQVLQKISHVRVLKGIDSNYCSKNLKFQEYVFYDKTLKLDTCFVTSQFIFFSLSL